MRPLFLFNINKHPAFNTAITFKHVQITQASNKKNRSIISTPFRTIFLHTARLMSHSSVSIFKLKLKPQPQYTSTDAAEFSRRGGQHVSLITGRNFPAPRNRRTQNESHPFLMSRLHIQVVALQSFQGRCVHDCRGGTVRISLWGKGLMIGVSF